MYLMFILLLFINFILYCLLQFNIYCDYYSKNKLKNINIIFLNNFSIYCLVDQVKDIIPM